MMSYRRSMQIVSILMESPLYLTLSIKERSALIARIEESYPLLFKDDEEEETSGHKGSRKILSH